MLSFNTVICINTLRPSISKEQNIYKNKNYRSGWYVALVPDEPAGTLAHVVVAAVHAIPPRGTRVRRAQIHLEIEIQKISPIMIIEYAAVARTEKENLAA